MEVRRFPSSESELTHHGIKGQKWGVRRYQNPDGSLTAAGRKKLGRIETRQSRDMTTLEKNRKWLLDDDITPYNAKVINKVVDKRKKTLNNYYENKKAAALDKDYKKTSQYKSAVKEKNKLYNRTSDPYGVTDGSTDIFSINSDVHRIMKNTEKTHKLLQKYRNSVLETGGSKKTEKARKKLEKSIEKSNKILMEAADGRIEGYKFSNTDDNTYLDFGFKDNSKK